MGILSRGACHCTETVSLVVALAATSHFAVTSRGGGVPVAFCAKAVVAIGSITPVAATSIITKNLLMIRLLNSGNIALRIEVVSFFIASSLNNMND
jgi:hypothetical protein